MDIFSKLFGSRSPQLPSIDHSVFGRMDATLAPEPGVYFWETPGDVETAFGKISVFCDAPESGPTAEQVGQFQKVCDQFQSLREASRAVLLDRLSDYDAGSQIDQMKWTSILLATDGQMTSHWELTFEKPNDMWLFNVNFKEGKPDFVTIDS